MLTSTVDTYQIVTCKASDYARHIDRAVLSADEIARAQRYRFAKDRDRFLAVRALLRRGLAAWAGVSAQALTFGYTAYGKPFLPQHAGLFFSVSHAREASVIGISHAPIGIDLAICDNHFDYSGIPDLVFHQEETAWLYDVTQQAPNVPPLTSAQKFYYLWTRKEALLKALGMGLAEQPTHHNTLREPSLRTQFIDNQFLSIYHTTPARVPS